MSDAKTVSPEKHPRALLDATELERLCAALNDDRQACHSFITSFCARWPARLLALSDAIDHAEFLPALDAVLSIKSSAGMMGALRLVDVSTQLEASLRDAQASATGVLLDRVRRTGDETVLRLGEFLAA